MRSIFKILFYINKNKTKADGTTAILFRITIYGANVVIITGESTTPHDWSVKRGEITDKKTNQRRISSTQIYAQITDSKIARDMEKLMQAQ